MLNLYCSNCHKSFAQAESKEKISEVLDNVKACPLCNEDYIANADKILYTDEGGLVYLADYKHPAKPEPVLEPVKEEVPEVKEPVIETPKEEKPKAKTAKEEKPKTKPALSTKAKTKLKAKIKDKFKRK